MTDELLKGMAAQVANMAKTDLRYRHQLNGILAVYFEGKGLLRMRKLEKTCEELGGVDWLNHGRAKEIIFGILAASATAIPPDAIVVSTAADCWRTTAAFNALTDQDKDQLHQRVFVKKIDHPRDHPRYWERYDILMVVAQTPERVCLYRQGLRTGGLLIGTPDVTVGPQSGFDGRLKLYGVEIEPEISSGLDELLRMGVLKPN